MARAYATYNPLRVFALLGGLAAAAGMIPILRFLWFWAIGEGGGHVQSLVLGGALIVVGVMAVMFGILADLIGANRKLLEFSLVRLRVGGMAGGGAGLALVRSVLDDLDQVIQLG